METLSPETLARLCQQTLPEDTRAFEALVAQFKGRVYATAYRLMSDPQDAEDQVQEVFIKIYRGIRDLDDPSTVATWIYRVTTNTCMDALAKRQRAPRTTSITPLAPDHGQEMEYADTRTGTPEELALQHELRACLEDTLQQLDVAERALLVLRDVEGRAYQEIAETFVVGLGAVKMRIHRARLAFQHLFERICPDLWRTVELPPAVDGLHG
jgi:RNA polymerase sigma-70 factor (ECF subfamily)